MSFFDVRLMITSLKSSNFSSTNVNSRPITSHLHSILHYTHILVYLVQWKLAIPNIIATFFLVHNRHVFALNDNKNQCFWLWNYIWSLVYLADAGINNTNWMAGYCCYKCTQSLHLNLYGRPLLQHHNKILYIVESGVKHHNTIPSNITLVQTNWHHLLLGIILA